MEIIDPIQRAKQYAQFGYKTQTLFDLLYPTGYATSFPHPLEPIILSFEEQQDSEETVRALGAAYGIFIESDLDYAAELFFYKMQAVIEEDRLNPNYSPFANLQQLLDLSKSDFIRFLEEYQIKPAPTDDSSLTEFYDYYYQNRLIVYYWVRKTTLLKDESSSRRTTLSSPRSYSGSNRNLGLSPGSRLASRS